MSALLGSPPNSDLDREIVRGLSADAYIPLDKLDVNQAFPVGPPRPQGYVYEDQTASLLAATSIALFFLISITVLRLIIRARHGRAKWGWDDTLVIPAAVSPLDAQVHKTRH